MRMRAALFVCIALVLSQQAIAQEFEDNPLFPRPRARRIFIGPIVGYNDNFNSGGFLTLGQPALATPDCGAFNQGTGNGILAGLTAEYWFKEGGTDVAPVPRVLRAKTRNVQFARRPEPYFDETTSQEVWFAANRNVESKYNLINLEVQYKYNLPSLPHFGVAIGPKFGLLSSSNYVQTQTLLPENGTTGNFTFKGLNTNVESIVPSGPIAGASTFRLGLIASLQYEALLGPFLVTPRISYDLGVTKIVSSWEVSSLIGSIELKYGL